MKRIDMKNIVNEINFCDGSLRDIYVHDTSPTDWNKMLSIVGKKYKVSTTLEEDMPNDINDLVRILENQSVTMSIDVGNDILINCHFFVSVDSMAQIEFDYDPKQTQTAENFKKVCNFVRNLGTSLNKKVFITPENCSDDVMLEFDNSSNQFIYLDTNKEHYLVQNL